MTENTTTEKTILSGLTDEEVAQRRADGRVNGNSNIPTKTIKQIIRTNVLTFFNLLNVVLAACVIGAGIYSGDFFASVKNCLFMGVIICNTGIGIFQEVRAKRVVDKLSLISAPKAHVIRGGEEREIAVADIVLDDMTTLSAGGQVCADSVVVSGECELNESLITGESDPVYKKAGDEILSGSFVVCGDVKAKVVRIGAENFASKITNGAKYLKKNNSEMLRAINSVIKIIAFCIIPISLILFGKSIFITSGGNIDTAIYSTVAAVIGMIPEGLVLLASMVLAVSVIRLSMHKTLVQELYCIETLARVDVLCLDKTGTITEGTMQVDDVIPLCDGENTDDIITNMMTALNDKNPTFNAIKDRWSGAGEWKCVKALPFSSAKKWSGAQFDDKGTYILGAGEFVLGAAFEQIRERVETASAEGERVLVLARSDNPFREKELPENVQALALILISDKIRAEAPSTLKFFAEQGVDLRIISGDNPVTVASIAKKAGLDGAENYVDMTTVTDIQQAADKYKVFGRVTPDQKLALVKALRAKGHIVGMTGDGVNDVLALKEADCSIAMQSGSDAARSVSNLVLLDSNFASMPKVVAEGRRSINNIERSASLFLSKTVYSFLLAIIFVFVQKAYPFQPIQMTLINAVSIGIPSFLLALEPNFNLVRGKFISNVMSFAIPYGLAMVLNIVGVTITGHLLNLDAVQTGTLATLVAAVTAMSVLFRVCMPFNWRKVIMFVLLCGIFTLGILGFPQVFDMGTFTPEILIAGAASLVTSLLFVFILPLFTNPLARKLSEWNSKR